MDFDLSKNLLQVLLLKRCDIKDLARVYFLGLGDGRANSLLALLVFICWVDEVTCELGLDDRAKLALSNLVIEVNDVDIDFLDFTAARGIFRSWATPLAASIATWSDGSSIGSTWNVESLWVFLQFGSWPRRCLDHSNLSKLIEFVWVIVNGDFNHFYKKFLFFLF